MISKLPFLSNSPQWGKTDCSLLRQLSSLQTCKHTLHDASPRPISSQQANRWFEIVCSSSNPPVGAVRILGVSRLPSAFSRQTCRCRFGSSFTRIMPEWELVSYYNHNPCLSSVPGNKPFPFGTFRRRETHDYLFKSKPLDRGIH